MLRTGKWNDKDPLWTAALKREMQQSDKEDGMFWYVTAHLPSHYSSHVTIIRAFPIGKRGRGA